MGTIVTAAGPAVPFPYLAFPAWAWAWAWASVFLTVELARQIPRKPGAWAGDAGPRGTGWGGRVRPPGGHGCSAHVPLGDACWTCCLVLVFFFIFSFPSCVFLRLFSPPPPTSCCARLERSGTVLRRLDGQKRYGPRQVRHRGVSEY
ncbi:unnamed protein product [Diplocarpon coronariae]